MIEATIERPTLTQQEADDILHEAIWMARDDNRANRGTVAAYAHEIIAAKAYLNGLVPKASRSPEYYMERAKKQGDIVE